MSDHAAAGRLSLEEVGVKGGGGEGVGHCGGNPSRPPIRCDADGPLRQARPHPAAEQGAPARDGRPPATARRGTPRPLAAGRYGLGGRRSEGLQVEMRGLLRGRQADVSRRGAGLRRGEGVVGWGPAAGASTNASARYKGPGSRQSVALSGT
jgi:hypothetical protein